MITKTSMYFLPKTILTALAVLPFISYAGISYSIAPLVIDIEAEARDILTHEFTLTNNGGQPVTVYPTVNNISIDDGGTADNFVPSVQSDRTGSLASWIEISRRGINLPAGETKMVTMTLRVHPNPAPGEYHARIGFGSGRNQNIAEQQVASGRAPSSIVTVTIGKDTNEYLKLSRFIIDRFVTTAVNKGATYIINNPGDEILIPTGEIIFYDSKGAEVAALPVNETGEQILPGEEKEFNVDVPTGGLFGKYKAFLSVEYGSGQIASVQDTTFFYVFPIKTILIILGVLMVFVAVVAMYVHRRYLDDTPLTDSDTLPFHIKDTFSDSLDHDIDLKQK